MSRLFVGNMFKSNWTKNEITIISDLTKSAKDIQLITGRSISSIQHK